MIRGVYKEKTAKNIQRLSFADYVIVLKMIKMESIKIVMTDKQKTKKQWKQMMDTAETKEIKESSVAPQSLDIVDKLPSKEECIKHYNKVVEFNRSGKIQQYLPAICYYVSEGVSLNETCRALNVPRSSVLEYLLNSGTEWADKYERARKIGIEAQIDKMIDIADNCIDPAKARVQNDTRKWISAKILPKTYGDLNKAAQMNIEKAIINVDMSSDVEILPNSPDDK